MPLVVAADPPLDAPSSDVEITELVDKGERRVARDR
jgi:hypothetical protein